PPCPTATSSGTAVPGPSSSGPTTGTNSATTAAPTSSPTPTASPPAGADTNDERSAPTTPTTPRPTTTTTPTTVRQTTTRATTGLTDQHASATTSLDRAGQRAGRGGPVLSEASSGSQYGAAAAGIVTTAPPTVT